MKPHALQTTLSGLLGALAVILGAFGAHGLKTTLEANQTLATWETAAHYHLVHAGVMLALALTGVSTWGWRLMMAGVLIFSGTLYVLSLTGIKWLGAITPIGGACLILGWILVAVRK